MSIFLSDKQNSRWCPVAVMPGGFYRSLSAPAGLFLEDDAMKRIKKLLAKLRDWVTSEDDTIFGEPFFPKRRERG